MSVHDPDLAVFLVWVLLLGMLCGGMLWLGSLLMLGRS